jgi:3-hydroxyisobutyrate dehydrogenase-like beta-hydroxyacid dehydrogenase
MSTAGSPLSVAVIGTGRMGSAMAERLRSVGAEVILFNRTRSTAVDLAGRIGATAAATAAEAAAAAPVVLVSLADDAACRAAYSGPAGIAAGVSPGAVVADTSTIDPITVRELSALVSARGGALLDAPVSGSGVLAVQGQVTVMVGGNSDALRTARPVLELIGRLVVHVGEQGAGATMKLAVNAVVHAVNQALAEALVLAEKAGVAREIAYEVFANSAIGSPFVQYKRAAFERPDEAPTAFSLDLVAKDYDLIIALAERVGAEMKQARVGQATVRSAVRAGLGGRDMSALAGLLRGSTPLSHNGV